MRGDHHHAIDRIRHEPVSARRRRVGRARVTSARPRHRDEQRRAEVERGRQPRRICQAAHDQRAEDLATVRHRAEPADGQPVQGGHDLVADHGGGQRRHEAGHRPQGEAPDAEQGRIGHERHAAEHGRVAEQAGEQHARAPPPVRETATEPQRHQPSDDAHAGQHADGFRPDPSPVHQIERKEEHQHAGLDGGQDGVDRAHDGYARRTQHRSELTPIARPSPRASRRHRRQRPARGQQSRHEHARRLEDEGTGHPGPGIGPPAGGAPHQEPRRLAHHQAD